MYPVQRRIFGYDGVGDEMRPKNYRKSASQIFGTDIQFDALADDDVLQYDSTEEKIYDYKN